MKKKNHEQCMAYLGFVLGGGGGCKGSQRMGSRGKATVGPPPPPPPRTLKTVSIFEIGNQASIGACTLALNMKK